LKKISEGTTVEISSKLLEILKENSKRP